MKIIRLYEKFPLFNCLNLRNLFTTFIFFLLFMIPSYSNVITVGPLGDYQIIQLAIDSASNNDAIIVSEGTYFENINFKGKNIILLSFYPTYYDVVSRTIINGNNNGPVVTFSGSENETCAILGFTITNGNNLSFQGGGIKGNGTKATISYNRIIGNWDGGVYDCDGLIEHNLITHNAGPSGYYFCGLFGCDGLIKDNIITENNGSGLYSCQGTIQNNVITKNSNGGLDDCDGTIENNEIAENTTLSYGSDRGGGLTKCNGTIQNNKVTGNSSTGGGGGLSLCTGGIIQNNVISENCSYYNMGGGGLYFCSNIKNNVISDNSGFVGGGLSRSSFIENNIICGNWAYEAAGSGIASPGGGGLYNCNEIRTNIICGNLTFYAGGGLSNCDIIINNLIYGNEADFGGGVSFSIESSVVYNNTIYANYAYHSGGGIYFYYRGAGNVKNCIIWQNSSPNNAQIFLGEDYSPTLPEYCCIQDWTLGGTGNITDDPKLVDPDGPANDLLTYEDNNFHLSVISPCIDAGCSIAGLTQDFEGNPRPYNASPEPRGDGSDFDIGAYEFIGSTTYVQNWMFWD